MKYIFATLLLLSSLLLYGQDHKLTETEAFTVKGSVKNELRLTLKDLLNFRQDSIGDVIVKNKRGETKDTAQHMKGVLLKTILDSAHVTAAKHKEYSELCIILIASDNYRNVYSWNELFNTAIGDHVYIITEIAGKALNDISGRILVYSLSDFNSGRRHLKGLARIEVKKVE